MLLRADAADAGEGDAEREGAAVADLPGHRTDGDIGCWPLSGDGRNAYLGDGVERALGREARDFADYAHDTAAAGVWDG